MPESRLLSMTRVLFGIAMAALAAMGMLTVVDVALRYAIRMPIPGSYELVSFLGAIGLSLALPHLQARNGHIVVDLVLNRLQQTVGVLVKMLVLVLTAALMLLLSWRLGVNMLAMRASGQVSDILSMPLWQIYAIVSVGPACTTLICMDQLVQLPESAQA